MSTAIYNIALVIHVIGITLMGGITFIDFIMFRWFCKSPTAPHANYLYKLQRFLGVGMLLILLSGITMMAKLHEVWGAQVWFRIKMCILLLIIINGLGLRRIVGSNLRKLLSLNVPGITTDPEWTKLKANFTLVQVVQILLFITIYILSVFKFN